MSTEPILWGFLHDGGIEAITGTIVGTVSINVSIRYLRQQFPGEGTGFRIDLFECSQLSYQEYDAQPVTEFDAIAALEPELVSAEKCDDRILVHCAMGTLSMAYQSVAIHLDTGETVSLDQLETASKTYWKRFSMAHLSKEQFLKAYRFPLQWLLWDLYPDALHALQAGCLNGDDNIQPSEHMRYGAFRWWTHQDRDLSEEVLVQLGQLALLDPDPAMAASAMHDILFHPHATVLVVDAIDESARDNVRWNRWFSSEGEPSLFRKLLDEGRMFWKERHDVHRLANDIPNAQMDEQELRELFAKSGALVLRGLVEHPNLPADLLQDLSERQSIKYARIIRAIASQRLAGKSLPLSEFVKKYSTDPWSWPW